jgi:hypothetical protein
MEQFLVMLRFEQKSELEELSDTSNEVEMVF